MTAAEPTPAGVPRPRHRRPSRWLRILPAITLAAVLTITASTEFTLARTVLALPSAIAWALPVAIDSYVLAALRSGRDVPAAITVMAGALTAAMGAHLAAPDGAQLPNSIRVLAATGIMTALVMVAWRVHVLIDHQSDEAADARDEHVSDATVTGAAASASVPASTPVSVEPRPTVAAVVGVSGGRGVAAPAVPAASTPAGTASTPVPATAAARTSAPRTTATTAIERTAPSTSDDTKPGLTDAQILADLNGTSPGVRPLMRTYAIGQGRAARLHREATATAERRPTDRSRQNAQQAAQPTESDQRHPEPEAAKGTSISTEQNEENHDQETEREIQHDQNKESHPCITDRVGQSRSTPVDEEMASGTSLSDFARAGER